jgi:O-antigen biosynthesis protein
MPRFSVLTTVFNPPRDALVECLESVRQQSLVDWQHVLVNDGSTLPWVAEVLDEAALRDQRLKVVHRKFNGGIVAASNDALSAATGELVALLDHDDVLHREALEVMSGVYDGSTVDVAYSDSDRIRPDGRHSMPFFKPDFSPERLRSQNYITHLTTARRSLVVEVGGFRPGFDGSQDHDLLLRLTERARCVAHVPRVLYHWREAPSSVASDPSNKPYAYENGRRAIQEQCDRLDIDAEVELGGYAGCYRVRRRVVGEPFVSVLIPTRGSNGTVWGCERSFVVDAVASIERRSTYRNLEYVVVHDLETPASTLSALGRIAGQRLKLVPFAGTFNFSRKMNLAAVKSIGTHLLLLNDDTELIDPDSISVLVAHTQMPDVAMAGGRLLFADGTLQHAGHVYAGRVDHALVGWPGEHPGPYRMNVVERECSGVTAAAAVVRRDSFFEVGGFCEQLAGNFNDVDLSLKLRAHGYRIVWSPFASWYHFESASRDPRTTDLERDVLLQRWRWQIERDPYFNPNLLPLRSDWLERPQRISC